MTQNYKFKRTIEYIEQQLSYLKEDLIHDNLNGDTLVVLSQLHNTVMILHEELEPTIRAYILEGEE